MTTSIRTTERIPITKTPPKTELGMTINWNNSLVKHWGIFPPQTKPGKPGRHYFLIKNFFKRFFSLLRTSFYF